MRKTVSCILLAVFCLSLAACSAPDNFPGQVKPKYWVSEDEKIIFFFPAEAGRGNAEGRMIVDEAICRDIMEKTGLLRSWIRNVHSFSEPIR